jgi:methylated-DNA-protein-cysteine methyltransferase-like protein
MARSANFARIKAQVLDIVARVPEGRLTTYAAVGDELAVPARHVAYILASLAEDDAAAVPWHRVVAEDGGLGTGRRLPERRDRLTVEGFLLRGDTVVDLDARFVHVALDAEHRLHPDTPLDREPGEG